MLSVTSAPSSRLTMRSAYSAWLCEWVTMRTVARPHRSAPMPLHRVRCPACRSLQLRPRDHGAIVGDGQVPRSRRARIRRPIWSAGMAGGVDSFPTESKRDARFSSSNINGIRSWSGTYLSISVQGCGHLFVSVHGRQVQEVAHADIYSGLASSAYSSSSRGGHTVAARGNTSSVTTES